MTTKTRRLDTKQVKKLVENANFMVICSDDGAHTVFPAELNAVDMMRSVTDNLFAIVGVLFPMLDANAQAEITHALMSTIDAYADKHLATAKKEAGIADDDEARPHSSLH